MSKKTDSDAESANTENTENKFKSSERSASVSSISKKNSLKLKKKKAVEDEKTIETLVSKSEKPSILKTIVNTEEKKTKLGSNSVNKIEDNKENKENKHAWQRSTRIDRKLSDIFYISALYGKNTNEVKTTDVSVEKPKIKKNLKKKKKKKIIRSKSAKNSIKNKSESSSSDEEEESKSTEKKTRDDDDQIEKKTKSPVKNERQPPLLYPTKNDKKSVDNISIKKSLEKIASQTYIASREEDKVFTRVYQREETLQKNNEATVFVRSLKKDM